MSLTINDEVYYSPREVAKELRVTRCTITNWTKQGYVCVSQNKRVKRKIKIHIYEDQGTKYRYIHQKTLDILIKIRDEEGLFKPKKDAKPANKQRTSTRIS